MYMVIYTEGDRVILTWLRVKSDEVVLHCIWHVQVMVGCDGPGRGVGATADPATAGPTGKAPKTHTPPHKSTAFICKASPTRPCVSSSSQRDPLCRLPILQRSLFGVASTPIMPQSCDDEVGPGASQCDSGYSTYFPANLPLCDQGCVSKASHNTPPRFTAGSRPRTFRANVCVPFCPSVYIGRI